LKQYKAGKISPFNFFSLVFICKMLVAFTSCTLVLKGSFAPDIIISVGISFLINLVLSLPLVYACRNGKNPLNIKWLSVAYGVYFLYVAAILVSRFSFFASTELNPKSKVLFYAFLIILFCVYAAVLGIEPVSRFAMLVFAVTIIGMITIVMFGVQQFEMVNLFPFSKNQPTDIMVNSLCFAGDASELILFLTVAPKVNGNKLKPFYTAVGLSCITCLGILLVVLGVLGDTAAMSAFPMFEVSQVSKFSDNERLDSVYTAFWIFAIFLKCTVFLYAATVAFDRAAKKTAHTRNCIVSGIILFAFCACFTLTSLFVRINIPMIIVPYAFFGLLIPVCSAVFQKKDKGEILLEKF